VEQARPAGRDEAPARPFDRNGALEKTKTDEQGSRPYRVVSQLCLIFLKEIADFI
jgi:hypothetical protein